MMCTCGLIHKILAIFRKFDKKPAGPAPSSPELLDLTDHVIQTAPESETGLLDLPAIFVHPPTPVTSERNLAVSISPASPINTKVRAKRAIIQRRCPRPDYETFERITQIQHAFPEKVQKLVVPQILGLASCLEDYQELWQTRYKLEIQLPHQFRKFREKFQWAGIPDRPIVPVSVEAETSVLRQLISTLRETMKYIENALQQPDNIDELKRCRAFWTRMVRDLERDIGIYVDILDSILTGDSVSTGECLKVNGS